MHKFLITVVILSIVGLLSCSIESGGGSDAPAVDVEASWFGCMAGDERDGIYAEVNIIFRYEGSGPSDGSLQNDVRLFDVGPCPDIRTPRACGAQRCPVSSRSSLSGTQRGTGIKANVHGLNSDASEWELEVVGTDFIEGTYEYEVQDSNLNDSCGLPSPSGVVMLERGARPLDEKCLDELRAGTKVLEFVNDQGTDGVVDPGDVLRFEIFVDNNGTDNLVTAALQANAPANTNYIGDVFLNEILVPGTSPLIAGIPISSSDQPPPLPAAGMGELSPGESATITFELEVEAGTPDGTEIRYQATVLRAGAPDLLTTVGNPLRQPEPTIITVGAVL
jgi:hypothetical protein